ncbi:MAG: capsular polysaccharide biosynthesis protein [bacterium P3]|nr:MAG: capsular polysaccharide biosynthesis protein [bacterium P3]KWW41082.1 MAG: capsular polysaccharide biosynthesis protein [bacterium F083]
MFSFLHAKNKPLPIFESLGTDMHCHLVPGVDDGSNSAELSISCLKQLSALGFKQLYITPHFQYPRFNNDEADIQDRYAVLKQQAEQAGVNIALQGVAGEYRIDDRFAQRVADRRFLRIAGKYVLVELSLHQPRMGTAEAIYGLQETGCEVIMAHPERYPYLSLNSAIFEQLKNQDVFFQVNILSLTGFYGERARRIGYGLIERGWVEFLGTDTHNDVYIHMLTRASHDRKLQKLLDKCEFMNCKL